MTEPEHELRDSEDMRLLYRVLKPVEIGAYLEPGVGFESPSPTARAKTEKTITDYLVSRHIVDKGQIHFLAINNTEDSSFAVTAALDTPLSNEQKAAARALLGEAPEAGTKLTQEQVINIYNRFDENYAAFYERLEALMQATPPNPSRMPHNFEEGLYSALDLYLKHGMRAAEKSGKDTPEPLPVNSVDMFSAIENLWMGNNHLGAQILKEAKATADTAISQTLGITNNLVGQSA